MVDQEVVALKAGDFETFKQCVIASGYSSAMNLQNVFAVVNPQEQGLSALALYGEDPGKWRRYAFACTAAALPGTVGQGAVRYAGRVQGRDAERLAKRAVMQFPCAARAARK